MNNTTHHTMQEKESLGVLAKWWKEIANQMDVKVLMAILFMIMGYFNKISYDILQGKKLSIVSNIARAVISFTVGSLALWLCLSNDIGTATYIIPFLCSFLGDKLMKFVLVNFERIILDRFSVWMSKMKLIFTLLTTTTTPTSKPDDSADAPEES